MRPKPKIRPLLCPSPVMLDQTFPRDDDQLMEVGIALGEIQEYLETDQVLLVKTEILGDFVKNIESERLGANPLLGIISNLLTDYYLKSPEFFVDVESYLSEIPADVYNPHPVPQGTEEEYMVELWAEEVGKLLYLHDLCCKKKEFFIGIACELAFADGEGCECQYAGSSNDRRFPLVGPDDLSKLADAYEWNTDRNIHNKKVTFKQIEKNYSKVGAIKMEPAKGSHYKLVFEEGKGSWTFPRKKKEPIGDGILGQLKEKTGYPLNVIKTALIDGELPEQTLKLERAQRSDDG